MKQTTQAKISLIFIGMLWLLFPQIIFAYIDPGTGSYIFQIILASILGIAFTIKIYWIKIKTILINFFSKWFKKN